MSANGNSPATVAAGPRSRLPRWTRHETLVLIQAKPVRLKWAVVSVHCRRHGVERGPMQCRKRWGNLSWDLKKIVAWEKNAGADAAGAAAARPQVVLGHARGAAAREAAPSSFDREVYDPLVGAAAAKLPPDSGEELELDLAEGNDADEQPPIPMMVMPISARMYVPPASSQHECSDPVTESAKKSGAASDKNSTSQQDSEATATATAATTSIGKQVTEALERGNRLLADQLGAQKASWDMDREHRRALLAAVNKLADKL